MTRLQQMEQLPLEKRVLYAYNLLRDPEKALEFGYTQAELKDLEAFVLTLFLEGQLIFIEKPVPARVRFA